jgi:alcohol dehydrogenase class IV
VSGPVRRDLDGRTVVWGPGALAAADDLIGEGFTLLTTQRAVADEPGIAARARHVVYVPRGLVEDVAGGLRESVDGRRLVALGGGRVIDVAKALAAADAPRTVLAVPTTLSGAEMTRLHRHARGIPVNAPRVRPGVVINDPELSASAPEGALAASCANALGHALTALAADTATPGIAATGAAAIRLIAGAWAREAPDRPALALGALLAGAAVARTGLGLHHVMAQTAAREMGLGHAEANAAVLTASAEWLSARRPAAFVLLSDASGVDVHVVARVLRGRAGAGGLTPLADDAVLRRSLVEAVTARPEIARTGRAPRPAEVEALYLLAAEPLR